MKSKFTSIFILSTLLTGCSLFEYHPYEVRLDEHEQNLNSKAINTLQSFADSDTVTFLVLGDTQRAYDETEDFVTSANAQQADFVILAGDISDFGLDKEFQWVHDILDRLDIPYVAVIGNHDISGQGEAIFYKMFGPLNDSFVFRNFKFILLNTNSREYNYNGNVPDIGWLKNELDANVQQTVVIGHIPPFDADFDPNLEDDFAAALRESGNVKLSLFAHQHTYKNIAPYEDDIRYYITSSIAERVYIKVTLWKDSFVAEKITY